MRIAPHRSRRRTRFAVRAAVATAALLLLPACRFGMYPGSTVQGRHISGLYQVLFWFAIPVGVIVYGLILWSIVRYRRRRDDDGSLPAQSRYNVPIEIAYTAIPVVIVLILFAFTLSTMGKVDAETPAPALTVQVTGFRWQWRFDFPQHGFSVIGVNGSPTGGPTIELPVGRTIHVDVTAADVIHSFFVPEFNFKRDAIPGVTNQFDLSIPRAGVFRGECAEFCGLDHADMTFFIRAVPVAEFDAWLQHNEGAGLIQDQG